jgi:hypothetical protein
MCPRHATQLVVYKRDEPLERRSVAAPPIEEARDLRTALFAIRTAARGRHSLDSS